MNVQYIFQSSTEAQARADPVTGPYFNPTNANMLLDLWVYNLTTQHETTLSGYWFMIQTPNPVTALFNVAQLAFVFPGPLLWLNNIGTNEFTIIAGQFALPYINDWDSNPNSRYIILTDDLGNPLTDDSGAILTA